MPRVENLVSSSAVDLSPYDKATVYWCGKILSTDNCLWTIGAFTATPRVSLFTTAGDNVLDLVNSLGDKIRLYSPIPLPLDEFLVIACIFDLTQVGADQITVYVNGVDGEWTAGDADSCDIFPNELLYVGGESDIGTDLNSLAAIAVFPEAHSPAQIAAVSADWLAKAEGGV